MRDSLGAVLVSYVVSVVGSGDKSGLDAWFIGFSMVGS